MFKKKIVLALVFLILSIPGIGWANEPYERSHYLFQKIKELNAAGIYSDDEVSCVLVDLSQISTTGSVTAYTYENSINPVVTELTTRTMELNTATSNMTRYILGDIRSVYIEPPFNCSIAMSVYGRTSIPVYIYGEGKPYCIDEIEQALPDVFAVNYVPNNSKSSSNSGARVSDKPIELPVAESYFKALFSIDSTTITVSNYSIDESTTIQMDVAPEITNGKLNVPVKYLVYSLGVPESGIQWDGTAKIVTLSTGDTTITLTIGSTTAAVNGESIEMDTPPYIKDSRTMVQPQYIAKPLGATAIWDQDSQQMVIELPQPQE